MSELVLLTCLMGLGWVALRFLIPNEPELRVMGTICCAHKTIALGIPLIASILADSPNEGLYSVPLLIWHPLQLIVGSMFVSTLSRFIVSERLRLRVSDDNNKKGISEVDPELDSEFSSSRSSADSSVFVNSSEPKGDNDCDVETVST